MEGRVVLFLDVKSATFQEVHQEPTQTLTHIEFHYSGVRSGIASQLFQGSVDCYQS